MKAQLNVSNLVDTTSNDDLRQLFTPAGASVVAIKDREIGLSTGQAGVTMTTRADTREVITLFNAYRWMSDL